MPGRTSRESHPSEDLSELPLSGQEYQRRCCHRETDRHDLLSGRLDPLPILLAAFMQLPAQMDLRAPSNVAAHYLSLQGTPTDVFQLLDIQSGRYTQGLIPNPETVPPHYLSEF